MHDWQLLFTTLFPFFPKQVQTDVFSSFFLFSSSLLLIDIEGRMHALMYRATTILSSCAHSFHFQSFSSLLFPFLLRDFAVRLCSSFSLFFVSFYHPRPHHLSHVYFCSSAALQHQPNILPSPLFAVPLLLAAIYFNKFATFFCCCYACSLVSP